MPYAIVDGKSIKITDAQKRRIEQFDHQRPGIKMPPGAVVVQLGPQQGRTHVVIFEDGSYATFNLGSIHGRPQDNQPHWRGPIP